MTETDIHPIAQQDDLPPEPAGGRPYTRAQRAAMCIRGRTVLVSAAAGSGKTAVLTERIIRMLKGDSEHDPMSISRMLIVTFTKAAAGELKTRIAAALSDAIAADPGNAHLCRQLLLLGSANIGTIDSFFAQPVRTHFAKLGLPASLRHADEAELAPLYTDVMNRVVDDMYTECTQSIRAGRQDGDFLHLIDAILPLRDSSDPTDPFLSLYRKLIALPEGVDSLLLYAERMRGEADGDFFASIVGARLLSGAREEIGLLCRRTERACKEMETDPVLSLRYLPAFDADAALFRSLLRITEHGSYQEIADALSRVSFTKLGTVRATESAPRKEYMKDLRQKNKDRLKKITERLFAFTQEELSTQLRECANTCGALHRILSAFDRILAEEKIARGVCDFSDMPRYLLRLLENPDGTPSPLAMQFREEYDAVFIDEYQDVNRLQDRIFAHIGGNHRFMVGDIKQSIYGFREAEPAVFAALRAKLPPATGPATAAPDGCSVFMSANFRCDPNIIRFVNLVCAYTFAACPESIGYTQDDDLICGKALPSSDYVSPPVTLLLAEQPPQPQEGTEPIFLDADEAEAELVAQRICTMIGKERLANGALIRPGDIAVLVQAQSHANRLIALLTERGVPVSSPSYSNVLESAEMKVLLSLLEVLNNPRTDLSLSELLVCPAFGISFTLDELVTVRKGVGQEHALYDALLLTGEQPQNPLGEKCKRFCTWLSARRADTVSLAADRLLRTLSNDPVARRLTATPAFTALYDSACAYVRRAWNGLYGFLNYFRRLCDAGEGGVSEAANAEGAVSVMTIHKSKGLEFPVCFVFCCGKRFNLKDNTSPILFSKRIGAAVRSYDPETLERRDTVVRGVIADEILDQLIEERMRLLYVALTRAKERLYVSAAVTNPEKEADTAADAWTGDRRNTLAARTFLTWILSALHLHPEALEAGGCVKAETYKNVLPRPDIRVDITTRQSPDSPAAGPSPFDYASLAEEAPELCRDSLTLAAVPAKIAASLLRPNFLDSCILYHTEEGSFDGMENGKEDDSIQAQTEESIRRRLELMQSEKQDFSYLLSQNKRPTAVDLGNAAHRFLQFCDYAQVEAHGVRAETERLVKEGFLDPHTAAILNQRQAEAFFHSDLYRRIRASADVRREVRFTSFLPLRNFTANPKLQNLLGDRTLYVQGSIDLLLENSDGALHICDYKTDAVTPEERENPALLTAHMTERHGHQLRQYAAAVRRMYGDRDITVGIYSLPLGKEIPIDLSPE